MPKPAPTRRAAAAAIKRLRAEIDRIDSQILRLVNRRADKARLIGHNKETQGSAAYAPDREAEILRRLAEANPGPLSGEAIRAVFREIVSGSRALEQTIRVAYLGPEGTFSYGAARRHFGASVDYVGETTIAAVFGAVLREECHYGVVPVETSAGGPVVDSLDLFADYDLKISAEVVLPVHHCLLSKSKPAGIKAVHSKPQALYQCRGWLEANLPHADVFDAASTADAARLAAARRGVAAIGSYEAAKLYGLDVVAEHLEDDPHNQTRFWVLGRHDAGATGRDKTSVMFAITNRVGALADMLLPFKRHGLNLLKIESRPSKRRAWDYLFFLDFEGHATDARVKKALSELAREAGYLAVLGSYPMPDAAGGGGRKRKARKK
jgi:chorismate mutase/prephenate dehydratase